MPDELVVGVNCAMAQVTLAWDLAGGRWRHRGHSGRRRPGLYAIAVARERGAARIIVIDGVAERLEVASMFGADDFVDLRDLPARSAGEARQGAD